jgi:hypothetical protein
VLLFGLLCATNCATVASWEGALDAEQRKTSLGTLSPAVADVLAPLVVVLAIVATCAHVPVSITMPLALSAFLLAVLHAFRDSIGRDERTALADLALLTPLLRLFTHA